MRWSSKAQQRAMNAKFPSAAWVKRSNKATQHRKGGYKTLPTRSGRKGG